MKILLKVIGIIAVLYIALVVVVLFVPVNVTTPHKVGDALRIQRDLYIVDFNQSDYSGLAAHAIIEGNVLYEYLPEEVEISHIGREFSWGKISAILPKDSVVEIKCFDLEWRGPDFTYAKVHLYCPDNGITFVMSHSPFLRVKSSKGESVYYFPEELMVKKTTKN